MISYKIETSISIISKLINIIKNDRLIIASYNPFDLAPKMPQKTLTIDLNFKTEEDLTLFKMKYNL